MRFMTRVLHCLLLLAFPSFAAERSYWVWHRIEPLTKVESAELHAQHVTSLYWHAGTLTERKTGWRWSEGPHALAEVASGFVVVPVVRIESETHVPFSDTAALRTQLARITIQGSVQLDFDCPDRLLSKYAATLEDLRASFPKISITALAHWPKLKDFAVLAHSVSEICPMFYDLQADPTGVTAGRLPPPLLDPEQIEKATADWKSCKTPWRAGLPAFSRLTVFDASGYSRGQISDWNWEDVVFHKHLHALAPTRCGVTLLRADADTRVASRTLHEGDMLASRTADPTALAQAMENASLSGAAGVVFFRLPGRGNLTGFSLPALGSQSAELKLTFHREGDALVLKNESAADLRPRLSGERNDRDRGYALELDAPAAVFREAEPGSFWRVTAHTNADTTPRAASVGTATRLTFWFSHLSSGASVRSGIFQLAPAADTSKIRWRIVPLTEWQLLP